MQLIAVTQTIVSWLILPYLSGHKGLGSIRSLSSKEWNDHIRQLIADSPLSLTVKFHEVRKSQLILECMFSFQR